MKKFYLLLGILNTFVIFGQLTLGGGPTASVTADLPNISPPSPTVASLMKFEEVPVDNYTGVPDISIPIYSIQTLSKDIAVNIDLKYHPGSIAIKEVASYTGLGWNLAAGGSIGRTVMGLPDEVYETQVYGGAVVDRVGIYNDNANFLRNDYYKVVNDTETEAEFGRFCWGAFEKGIYDSEHDLYQYNFMGHSGRFYIRKNTTTGVLEPVKLDNDNSLKIEFSYNYNGGNTNRYTFNQFTIYDDKGYRYIFSTKEVTTELKSSVSMPFGLGGESPGASYTQQYVSSFHLTEIRDNNNQVLVTFSYQDSTEQILNKSMLYNYGTGVDVVALHEFDDITVIGFPPAAAYNNSQTTTVTKKLSLIDVKGKAKIYFELESGRLDANIKSGGSKLKSITVKNYLGEQIKKVELEYGYLSVLTMNPLSPDLKRLALMKVKESNLLTSETLNYELGYKDGPSSVNFLREDYWGYLRRGGFGKQTDPDYCTTHVLTDMLLPTKGNIHFDFEPNTYSYVGNQALTEFDNSTNYTDDLFTLVINPGQTVSNPLIVNPNTNQTISFEPEAPTGTYYYRMAVQSTGEEESINALGMTRLNDGSGTTEPFQFKTGETYTITMHRRDTIGQVTGNLVMRRKIPDPAPVFKAIYGGGVRIKDIRYIANDTIKQKHYAYHFFDDPERSSGSLVFAKPVFVYNNSKYYGTKCSVCAYPTVLPIHFITQTSFNNLLGIRTKGADVGYKNVTVWETSNGKSEFTYTSPIDHPETTYTINYPFKPALNIDYMRGLLTNEKHYSQVNNTYVLLNENIYEYPVANMDATQVTTGLRIYSPLSCPMAPMYDSWDVFVSCTEDPDCNPTMQSVCNPNDYLTYTPIYTAYGWPKLTTQTNKQYFYHAAGTPAKVVTTTQAFEYNAQNKRLSKTTTTNSLGDILSTEYTYDTNAGTNNRIGEIKSAQSKRNNDVLEKKEIAYSNSAWGSANTSFLPSTVSVLKGTNVAEIRLRFTMYDENSNPLEATLESGTPVVYIWGYNNTLPVAVIENFQYNSISSTLITNIKNASNQVVGYNEGSLLQKLEELRAALPVTAMVTTYTYKPLVGLTTATDAKGLIIRYHYDEFNRLWKITDKSGNILSENKYNYKTGY